MSAEETWLEVREHDPSWAGLYERESAQLKSALGSFAASIEHFGSTSVEGLAAKPIVDILVGTDQSGVSEGVLVSLARLGYEYLGEDGRRPGRFFFRKRGDHSFNVSIVPVRGTMWLDNLRLRDFLRSHPDRADDYAAVKRAAAEQSPDSMLGYQDGKRDFVEELKSDALAWDVSKDEASE